MGVAALDPAFLGHAHVKNIRASINDPDPSDAPPPRAAAAPPPKAASKVAPAVRAPRAADLWDVPCCSWAMRSRFVMPAPVFRKQRCCGAKHS